MQISRVILHNAVSIRFAITRSISTVGAAPSTGPTHSTHAVPNIAAQRVERAGSKKKLSRRQKYGELLLIGAAGLIASGSLQKRYEMEAEMERLHTEMMFIEYERDIATQHLTNVQHSLEEQSAEGVKALRKGQQRGFDDWIRQICDDAVDPGKEAIQVQESRKDGEEIEGGLVEGDKYSTTHKYTINNENKKGRIQPKMI